MKQQEALDALIGLGARLDAEFTQDELRAAFRMLALRYHPDRHVSSSDAERERLAMLFTRAHDAYERLKVIVCQCLSRDADFVRFLGQDGSKLIGKGSFVRRYLGRGSNS